MPTAKSAASVHPTLSQLRALLAVADAGGFSEAAAGLGVSQSSLSEAVGKLEEVVGRPLLRRSPAGTAVTPAGARVLVHARAAVQAAGDVLLAAQDEQLSGTLRVASYRSTATHLLPPALAAFRAQHPGVKFVLQDSESDACGGGEHAVRAGISDVAVVVGDVHADLIVTPLAQDEYLFVAPASRGTHPVSLSELVGQNLFMPPEKDSCHQRVRHYLERRGVSLRGMTENGQDSVILSLVGHGLGVTVMPRLALLPLSDALVALPLPDPLARPLGLAVLPQRANLPLIRAFTRTLVDSLSRRSVPPVVAAPDVAAWDGRRALS